MKDSKLKKQESDDHILQLGHKWCHALFRHMVKALDHDSGKCVQVLSGYLSKYHKSMIDDEDYKDSYMYTEEVSDSIISKLTKPKKRRKK